ncbi:MAG: flagellar export chaperone FliS [Solidesulfovibrio sp.]
MQSAARTYFQTQVTTTTQGDLVIMLFDAALKFLHQAKEKIVEKNYAQKGILISKTIDILGELQGSLNAQKGGDLADSLQKLYLFCSSRLLTANLKMDTAIIDEVVQILSGVRDAFFQANAQVVTKPVPVSAAQAPARMPTNLAETPAAVPRAHMYQSAKAPTPAKATPTAARPDATVKPAAPVVTNVAPPREIAPEVPETPTTTNPAVIPVRSKVMAAYAVGRTTG